MKTLTKIIKSRGYDVAEFARLVLGQEYKTFWAQIHKGNMRYKDIVKMLSTLNIKFEDLEKFKETKSAKIKINTLTLKGKDLKTVRSEQEWAKIYAEKIKKPFSINLLHSILKEERKLTLKEFCKTYQIREL